ncbi:MAG TPA: dTDP-4-dehydrorhamnose reductase [Rhodocyclaceae bacterium]|nr:dTDP-4-dehydrorhamnose reductase [Rhodocyclaceae bacterium]
MSRLRVLLLGANGQVGWALRPRLALDYDLVALDRQALDLSDLDALQAHLDAERPAAIVNAAAYTAVDRAEREPELAYRLNAAVPERLARWCAANHAALLHYSTDYVFDGCHDRPYRETDTPSPLNTYGASKLAGEQAVLGSGARAVVLRVSWVYGVHGNNFLKTMLRLARTRDQLAVVDDQIGAPTSAELIAAVSERLLTRLLTVGDRAAHAPSPSPDRVPPLLHLAPKGAVSWFGYARFLLKCAAQYGWPLRVHPDAIRAIPSTDYPTPAPRPRNSRLATDLLEQTLGVTLPSWETDVARTVEALVQCCSLSG